MTINYSDIRPYRLLDLSNYFDSSLFLQIYKSF